MAARSIDCIEERANPVPSAGNARRQQLLRPRLVVVAPNMVEVVQYAGGWLFDHILAGWDATVLVPDLVDTRPLQILGVGAVDRHTALSSSVRSPRPRAIAVAASLYAVDLRIRQELNGILDEGRTEVVLWGDKWPNSIDSGPEMTQHRLSAAAQAFKAQALTVAAGQVDTIGMVEKFGSAGAFALG